jgi:hypothetical protein
MSTSPTVYLRQGIVGVRNKAPLVGPLIDAGYGIASGKNPVDAAGKAIFGAAGGALGGGAAGFLGIPSGPGAVLAGMGGYGLGYTAGTSLYDTVKENLGNLQLPAGGMPGADFLSGIGLQKPSKRPLMNLPRSVNTNLAAYDESVTLPGVSSAGNAGSYRPTPEDRAYEQEKSRALQLAEQDQLAKKYQVADLTKQYNSASTPEEKQRIGLQIWATTNPQLAQSVSPRQVGYEQAQAVVKPPKDDKLDQTQKALLKQAFRRQLKK